MPFDAYGVRAGMRFVPLVVPVLLAAALLASAGHGSCDSGGQPALGIIEATAGHGNSVYIDDRGYVTGNGTWLYLETNGVFVDRVPGVYAGSGIAGPSGDLQRGDWATDCGLTLTYPCEICYDDSSNGPDMVV